MSGNNPLESKYPFLTGMHPAHLKYTRHLPLNTVGYFLGVLDKLDPEKRHEIMYLSFMNILGPLAEGQGREVYDLLEDRVAAYEHFKTHCLSLSNVVGDGVLVAGMVHISLSYIFDLGDTTSVDEAKDRLIRLVEAAMRNPKLQAIPTHDATIGELVEHIEYQPEKAEEYHRLYVYFYEHVVEVLLHENFGLSTNASGSD